MGLLNPAALYFLGLVPALLIAYLARERPRRVIVSSVLAFRALHAMRGERFGGRPRFPWTFFLELSILCLAVLAMASPYLQRKRVLVAAIVDNSAAMQARTADGRTRYQVALAAMHEALAAEPNGSRISLYLTSPTPHLSGDPMASSNAASALLERARVSDAPLNSAAFASQLSQLAADRRFSQVIVASYRQLAPPAPARIRMIAVGGALPNSAIGGFWLTRETIGTATLSGRLTVANFSQSAANLRARIIADGKPVASAQRMVAPGETITIDFPGLPPAPFYRAELEPADLFPLDNLAFATAPGVKTTSILFVSPVAADGESLKAIPGVKLETRTPGAYSPRDLANSDVAIFEYTLPKELPPVNTLFVMPPAGDPIFHFASIEAGQLQLTEWPATDPLTDGVNFRLLNIRSGEYLGEHPWMEKVVSGARGGLLIAGTREGHRYVATGFNPFPYLGRANLPMSILTLNLLSRLAGLSAQAAAFHTGESWMVPAGVDKITLPSGDRVRVQAGHSFSGTDQQGIYQLAGPAGKTLRAVNLADLATSNLADIAPINLAPNAETGSAPAPMVAVSLAPYLIIAIVILILLEAFIVYRGQRRLAEVSP